MQEYTKAFFELIKTNAERQLEKNKKTIEIPKELAKDFLELFLDNGYEPVQCNDGQFTGGYGHVVYILNEYAYYFFTYENVMIEAVRFPKEFL